MGRYVPNTKEEQLKMLNEIGYKDFDDLFSVIPESVRLKNLNLEEGKSELETATIISNMASKNKQYKAIYRGAGAYDHYIPSIVKQITSKEEFVTAYTPYQAEISQGILQSIFEYQTAICQLTGMDVSNACVYDGGTAAAEACAMCKDRKHSVMYVSESTDPKVVSVIKTYCFGSNTEVKMVPTKDGVTDLDKAKEMMTEGAACLYIQQPNFFGQIEDAHKAADIAHGIGAKLIMGCNPMSLGIMETPREAGADIAVGEGQPLGLPIAFGGPYVGFMACVSDMMRKIPGRIVGQTEDHDGNRAYVLTLQAREQHIRREKASSNICSNEALCAMTVSVYLAAVGKVGLEEAAHQCVNKSHYLLSELEKAGLKRVYNGEFFHEFVTTSSVPADKILAALEAKNILGGYKLSDNEILWCATEKNTKASMDEVAAIVKEVCA
ncbi:MAG: aminomethyl-transferring glycine dehydrogenase subunit GcvPA [Lachnospiraceae bacterium]|nr:aminomethyl-transferring glycine dehydrogenase subunit GcvPA [Lachnospiraceae bacterium]MBO4461563.1 aminomethyl-transferring glycine dehydrogenase subunit GcvPA [Lachnospiraceae bacterium]MBR5788632.1 aminomethyl-transferring glycine dehydrogenase subunit GcvPA [Lachnospiraceae bacterium]